MISITVTSNKLILESPTAELPIYHCTYIWHVSEINISVFFLQEPTMLSREMGDYISLVLILFYAHQSNADCHLFQVAPPRIGRFCPTDEIPQRPVEVHACKYHCIQSKRCIAFNFNHTDKACTHMINPCAMALSYPDVQYIVFSQRPASQCYEWVLYSTSAGMDVMEDRTIHTNRAIQKISRLQKNGNDIVGHLIHYPLKNCYGWYGVEEIQRSFGLLCQYLRAKEGCTLLWVPYIAGQHVPPRSVIGGKMANGDVNYVVKLDMLIGGAMRHSAGYFTQGASYGVGMYAGNKGTATSMHVLIVLWGEVYFTTDIYPDEFIVGNMNFDVDFLPFIKSSWLTQVVKNLLWDDKNPFTQPTSCMIPVSLPTYGLGHRQP